MLQGLPLPLFAAGAVPPPLVWIDDRTVSGVTTHDIVWRDQAFEKVFLLADNLLPSIDNISFVIRTSSDNGATFDAGASDYQCTNVLMGVGHFHNAGAAARIQLHPSASQNVNYTLDLLAYGSYFTTITEPSNASLKTVIQTIGGARVNGGGAEQCLLQHGYRDANGKVNGVRYLNNTGTFAGRFQAWGLVL